MSTLRGIQSHCYGSDENYIIVGEQPYDNTDVAPPEAVGMPGLKPELLCPNIQWGLATNAAADTQIQTLMSEII